MSSAASIWLLLALSAPSSDLLFLPLGIKGKHDAALVAKINAELPTALAAHAHLLSDKAAKKRGKELPAAVSARCGPAPACLAAYGRKVQVERVLFGLASSEGKGVSVDFSLVSSADGAAVQRVSVVFASLGEVKKTAQENAARLLNSEIPQMPALQAIAPLKKKAPEPTSVAAAPPPIEPAPAQSALDSFLPPPEAAPGQSAPPRSRAMLWSGIAIAAAGVVGVGLGTYFGVQKLESDARGTRETLAQTQVPAEQERQTSNATSATICFVAGGIVTAVGAALIATDMVFEARSHATLSVSTKGASVGWEWAW